MQDADIKHLLSSLQKGKEQSRVTALRKVGLLAGLITRVGVRYHSARDPCRGRAGREQHEGPAVRFRTYRAKFSLKK